jgi:hypothetical protein
MQAAVRTVAPARRKSDGDHRCARWRDVKRAVIVVAASILSLVGGTASADVSVYVDTRSSSNERFLVFVLTRHADFHNGYSRVRFQGLVPANVRTRVPIDFYVSLVGHGVSADHPDDRVESAVTHSRWDELPTLVARRWDAILEDAEPLPVRRRVSGSHRSASASWDFPFRWKSTLGLLAKKKPLARLWSVSGGGWLTAEPGSRSAASGRCKRLRNVAETGS